MKLNVILIDIILFNNILGLKVSNVSSMRYFKKTNQSSDSIIVPSIKTSKSIKINKCGLSHYRGPAQRIVGGREAKNGEFPWTVSVHFNGRFKCGGSILDAFHILTAAHCLYGAHPSEINIRYNSLFNKRNASQRSASRLIIHPKYDIRTIENDIALIRLKNSLILDRLNSGTVCLPQKNHRLKRGQMMTVSGWGLTNRFKGSHILRTTEIPIVSIKTCRKQYRHLPDLYRITDNMICAGLTSGGQDSCNGDSGGPLVTSFKGKVFVLVGIVSKGYGCAQPNKAGVYTRVSNYLKWIEDIRHFTLVS